MERIWNILILLCAGGGIIAAWFLIPDRLLNLQRQEVFCSKVAVPIENVHPYEEEYAKLRKTLLRSIHVKTEGQYTILDSETVTEYANLSVWRTAESLATDPALCRMALKYINVLKRRMSVRAVNWKYIWMQI